MTKTRCHSCFKETEHLDDLNRCGKCAKEQEIQKVTDNAGEGFKIQVRNLVKEIPAGTRVTGEDIRFMAQDEGIEPHHHNAWGGVINGLKRSGLLEHTNQWVPMKDATSHARVTPVYVVTHSA